jgi:hypothetical protein
MTSGQTFAEYAQVRPVRKGESLHPIYLCLVGDFTQAQRRILALDPPACVTKMRSPQTTGVEFRPYALRLLEGRDFSPG